MNTLFKNIIPFIVVAVMASSCERDIIDLPESSSNDPIFRLEFNLDNSDIEVVAGIENIFNHTDFAIDQDEVYTFEGLLSDADCNRNCPNSYQFKFRNYETSAAAVNVNQSLSAKSYDFKHDQAPTEDAFELQMDINSDLVDPEFTWTINSQVFTQQEVSDILLLNVSDALIEDTKATLNVRDQETGLTSFSTRQIFLDRNIQGVTSSIQVTQIEGDSVLIEIVHSEDSEFDPFPQTTWLGEDLNGGNPFILVSAPRSFSLRLGAGKSIRNEQLFFSTLGGTETATGIDINYDPAADEITFFNADFNYSVENRIAQGSDLALQTFEFELYDEAGVLFSSAQGEQSADAFFEIIDTEDFIENDQGQKTIKVTCQFSCQVFSDSGETKTITDANAVIAVAIP